MTGKPLLLLPQRGHEPYVGGTVMNDYGNEGKLVARRALADGREKYAVQWARGGRIWYFADRIRKHVVVPKETR